MEGFAPGPAPTPHSGMPIPLRSKVVLAATALALASAVTIAAAQATGIKRAILQRADVDAGPEHKECVFGTAELAPGASVGKHIHPGIEVGLVAEGEGDLFIDGEAPRHMKAGDSYKVDVRKPHDAKNTGAGPMKLVATWVVEKGKPLAEPVK
jgi:quercetin dioxygenase-like cupin family protein